MKSEEVTKHLNILLANRCWNCRYERAGNKVCDEKCVFKQAVNEAIEALQDKEGESQFYTEDDYWNGMFTESEKAYKAWTGEETGKDIKAKQKEVGAVADGIVGYETIQKTVEKAKIVYGGTLDVVSGVLTVDNLMDMEQAIEWCKDCQHNEVCRYYPYDECEFKDTVDVRPTKKVQLTDDIEKELDEESYEIGYTHGQMAGRPTGEWVLSHIGTIAEGYYCSRCGKHGYQTDFCHNCGADMRGVNNGR